MIYTVSWLGSLFKSTIRVLFWLEIFYSWAFQHQNVIEKVDSFLSYWPVKPWSTLSWRVQWCILSPSQEHWMRGRNTPWRRHRYIAWHSAHTITHSLHLGVIWSQQSMSDMFLGGRRKLENPKETTKDKEKHLNTDPNSRSDLMITFSRTSAMVRWSAHLS